jgi:hypothetical protein
MAKQLNQRIEDLNSKAVSDEEDYLPGRVVKWRSERAA